MVLTGEVPSCSLPHFESHCLQIGQVMHDIANIKVAMKIDLFISKIIITPQHQLKISYFALQQNIVMQSTPYCAQQPQQQSLRYSYLKQNLVQYDRQYLVNLLIEEVQQNDRLRAQIFQANNKLATYQEQQVELKDSIMRKREAFHNLSDTQQRTLNKLDSLEQELNLLKNKYKHNTLQIQQYKQSEWQRKYKELNMYTNEYVRNIKQVQEQFKRNYALLKNENMRLYIHNEQLTGQIKDENFKNSILSQELNLGLTNLKELDTKYSKLQKKYLHAKIQNEKLIAKFKQEKQNQKCLYENVMEMHTEREELKRQLVFVKDQLDQNSGLSKQIITRYEGLQNKYKNLQKQKERFIMFCRNYDEKVKQLESNIIKEININQQNLDKQQILMKQNQKLMQDIDALQNQIIVLRRNELQFIRQAEESKNRFVELNRKYTLLKNQHNILEKKLQEYELEYRKQFQKNQLIVKEVENFWKNRQNPLSNNINLTNSSANSREEMKITKSAKTVETDISKQNLKIEYSSSRDFII